MKRVAIFFASLMLIILLSETVEAKEYNLPGRDIITIFTGDVKDGQIIKFKWEIIDHESDYFESEDVTISIYIDDDLEHSFDLFSSKDDETYEMPSDGYCTIHVRNYNYYEITIEVSANIQKEEDNGICGMAVLLPIWLCLLILLVVWKRK